MRSTGLAVTAAVLAGGLAGYWLRGTSSPPEDPAAHFEVRSQAPGRLTNPLLECETTGAAVENKALQSFRKSVERQIAASVAAGEAEHASVYFRELNNGAWFSVNAKDFYVPGSLLKVPLMFALLHRAEDTPDLLTRKIAFTSADDWNRWELIKPSDPIQRGKKYSVEELVRRMIVHSDNNATALLAELLRPGEVDEVFRELGVGFHRSSDDDDLITVEEYASFFRILYNASFLNRSMSEKALRMLSEVEYSRGLRTGVPPQVPIAHKFGERIVGQDVPPQRQLHDCGIVYHPVRPYLVCIMTRGREFDGLHGVIADLSRVVYLEVDRQSPR